MSGMSEVPIHPKQHGTCECGHSFAAHGSNGRICGACPPATRNHVYETAIVFAGITVPVKITQDVLLLEPPPSGVEVPTFEAKPLKPGYRRVPVSIDGTVTVDLCGREVWQYPK